MVLVLRYTRAISGSCMSGTSQRRNAITNGRALLAVGEGGGGEGELYWYSSGFSDG